MLPLENMSPPPAPLYRAPIECVVFGGIRGKGWIS
jgi:hypothetical protein